MAEKKSVLFVCIHNSARSQMAAAFLQQLSSFSVSSAGLQAGQLNPLAVQAMAELGLDISKNPTTEISELLHQEKQFDYIITVCDEVSGELCPILPGPAERLHWTFVDPAQLTGSFEEKMAQIRSIRDQIQQKVVCFAEKQKYTMPATSRGEDQA